MLRFGLLGRSLEHSFSKTLFECLAKKYPLSYENFSVEPDKIGDFFVFAKNNLNGFNITVPYKLKPFEYPEIFGFSEESEKIGAVNTVVVKKDRLMAHNTDHVGFIVPLKNRSFKSALVFGAGGAARAVIYALRNIRVYVFNRTRDKARELVNRFPHVVPVEEPGEVIRDVDLIVNATSIGLHNERFYMLDPYREMNFSGKLFYDLIYNPPMTDFLKIGLKGGAEIINGIYMLIFQAVENIKIWLGRDLTEEVIRCSKSLLQESRTAGISWEF